MSNVCMNVNVNMLVSLTSPWRHINVPFANSLRSHHHVTTSDQDKTRSSDTHFRMYIRHSMTFTVLVYQNQTKRSCEKKTNTR